MGGNRGVVRAARRTRRSQRRLFPGGQYLGDARRRDRGRGSEGRLPLGPATAARAGDLSPQTVIAKEIRAPRRWAAGRVGVGGLAAREAGGGARGGLGQGRG